MDALEEVHRLENLPKIDYPLTSVFILASFFLRWK